MKKLNEYIDHTLLRPDATIGDIQKLLKETKQHKFASACFASGWFNDRVLKLRKGIQLATVIGFPHGNIDTFNKLTEIKRTDADEFDVVVNIGEIKSENWDEVNFELASIRKISKPRRVKCIVEVGYLTDEELYKIADILIDNKIDFIKTCTGYGPRGVTVEDIKKIKAYVGDRILIKASGGIKTKTFAEDLIAAGANRIGSSSSVEIVK